MYFEVGHLECYEWRRFIFRCGRPVRFMLDRDEDMAITGQRHPYLTRYKVGIASYRIRSDGPTRIE